MQAHFDNDILLRFTGQDSVKNPAEAERLLRQAEASLRKTAAERSYAARACWIRGGRVLGSLAAAYCHRTFDFCSRTGLPPSLTTMIIAAILCIIMALCLLTGHVSAGVILAAQIGSFLGGWGILWWWTSRSRKDEIVVSMERRRGEWHDACATKRRADLLYRESHHRYKAARQLYLSFLQVINSKLDYLLKADIDSMNGEQFERFLSEVFRSLGYHVRHMGHSGDQGVDLILEDAATRIAVQAKRYHSSVGNGAIQEVYAGMKHYGCQRCAVVTNQHFTRGAQSLARSVGCVLIDRHALRALIRGRMRL